MTDQALMRQARTSAGATCPSCNKHVKVYHRKFNSGMAYTLINVYRQARKTNNEWLHVGHFLRKECDVWPSDYAKIVWWSLMQKHPGKKKDGNSSGLYRMTRKGSMFVKGRITIPSHANEYMSEVESFDGDEINIVEALGKKFDYDELMRSKP